MPNENGLFTREEMEEVRGQLEAEKASLASAQELATQRDARISEMEAGVGTVKEAHEGKIKTLVQAREELAGERDRLKGSLTSAVSKYRALVVGSNPTAPESLIKGDTIEEIDSSLQSANALVEKVKASLESQQAAVIAAAKVPPGAPARTPPDLSSLSPTEKIKYAVAQGGK